MGLRVIGKTNKQKTSGAKCCVWKSVSQGEGKDHVQSARFFPALRRKIDTESKRFHLRVPANCLKGGKGKGFAPRKHHNIKGFVSRKEHHYYSAMHQSICVSCRTHKENKMPKWQSHKCFTKRKHSKFTDRLQILQTFLRDPVNIFTITHKQVLSTYLYICIIGFLAQLTNPYTTHVEHHNHQN